LAFIAPLPPSPETVVAEVQRYAVMRLANAARVDAADIAGTQPVPAATSSAVGPLTGDRSHAPDRADAPEPVGATQESHAQPRPRASEIDFD
jgi:hypothetical protein